MGLTFKEATKLKNNLLIEVSQAFHNEKQEKIDMVSIAYLQLAREKIDFLERYIKFIEPIEDSYREMFLQDIIEDHLSTRTCSALKKVGVNKMKDILNFTYKEILKINGIGNNSLRNIHTLIKGYGLSFKKQEEPNES